jgi:hypothetical protein
MLLCTVAVPAVVSTTAGFGWPVHQVLVGASLLLPMTAYGLVLLVLRSRR